MVVARNGWWFVISKFDSNSGSDSYRHQDHLEP